MPFNWFDILVGLMLFIGYQRGKTRGMSQESFAVMKWIAIVILAAIGYEPLGLWISSAAGLSKLLSFVLAYAAIAGVVALIFVFISGSLGEKLKGSDAFGKSEFYLGKPAGMLRFLCILLTLLALLNARFYSTAEVNAMNKFQNDNYGSSFFPHLYSIQDDIFKNSFVGSQVHQHLDFLLIKPTPAVGGVSAPTKQKEFTWQ